MSDEHHHHESAPSETSSDGTGVIVNQEQGAEGNNYHSLLYRLVTWKDPRESAIAFSASAFLIVASHYVPLVRYGFKLMYLAFGATVLAEMAGKYTVGTGLTSKFRPATYFTINQNSLERFLNDAAKLINFLVIEFQRVLYVENVNVTGAAFVATFISYWFVKYLPLWVLVLAADCLAFVSPLVYSKNKELIDAYVDRSAEMAQQHAAQLKVAAAKHAETASASLMNLVSPYVARLPAACGGGQKTAEVN